MSSLEEPIWYRFSALQGLRSLSLANVDFYDSGLGDVCSLPRLESLDLSNTSVTNLSPLLGLKERLRSLTLHQLKRLEMSTAQLLGVIGQLNVLQVSGLIVCLVLNLFLCFFSKNILRKLHLWGFISHACLCVCKPLHMQHLDISDDKQFTSDVARQLLGQPGILPALVSLDVSGRKQVCSSALIFLFVSWLNCSQSTHILKSSNFLYLWMLQVTDAAVKAFVEERPGMTFVGLLATDAGFSDFLSGEGNLKVGIEWSLMGPKQKVKTSGLLKYLLCAIRWLEKLMRLRSVRHCGATVREKVLWEKLSFICLASLMSWRSQGLTS